MSSSDDREKENLDPRPSRPIQLQRILNENVLRGGGHKPHFKSRDLPPSGAKNKALASASKHSFSKPNLSDSSVQMPEDLSRNHSEPNLSQNASHGFPAAASTPFHHPGGSHRNPDAHFEISSIDQPSSSDPSSSPFKTPNRSTSSQTGSGSKYRTPSGPRRRNPFDSGNPSDTLHLPTMSPSVFDTVLSPTQEESLPGDIWSLDQRAHLFPAAISEDSPWKQDHPHNSDPDIENKTQEAINKYFLHHHNIQSPPDLPTNNAMQLLAQQQQQQQNMSFSDDDDECPDTSPPLTTSMAQVEPKKCSLYTQTELSFPCKADLPAEIEAALKAFCTFKEDQREQQKEYVYDENNLSSSTLRRKLFAEDPESDACPRTPELVTGQIINTPLSSRPPNHQMSQWSSSPVRRAPPRTSLTPPAHLSSPAFSPISSRRTIKMDSVTEEENKEEVEWTTDPPRPRSSMSMDTDSRSAHFEAPTSFDTTAAASSLAQDTATSHLSEVAPLGAGGHQSSVGSSGYRSTVGLSSGYTEHSSTPSAMTTIVEDDSGMAGAERSAGRFELFGAERPPQYLVSYGVGENSNDISVGYPLGSSTPTK